MIGSLVRSGYAVLGIEPIEQTAWLGVIVAVLVWRAMRTAGRDGEIRVWPFVAGAFFVGACGPFLRIASFDTGFILPWAFARYVPLISNARMPGRAMIMVALALSVLAAYACRGLSRRSVGAIAALLLLETMPARIPLTSVPQPDAIDARLRQAPDSLAVLEVPSGIRDGFGATGNLDHRALAHQMAHEHPLVGGFVARMTPAVRNSYLASPFLRGAIGLEPPSAVDAAHARSIGVGYVIVNRDLETDPEWSRPALERRGFRFLLADGARELYSL